MKLDSNPVRCRDIFAVALCLVIFASTSAGQENAKPITKEDIRQVFDRALQPLLDENKELLQRVEKLEAQMNRDNATRCETVKYMIDTGVRAKQELIVEKTRGLNALEREGASSYAGGQVQRYNEIYAPKIKAAKEELERIQKEADGDAARLGSLANSCK